MRIRSIDPRDAQWEDDSPSYRVYFWYRVQGQADQPQSANSYRSTEFEIQDADIEEVLAWAENEVEEAGTYTVHAVARDGDVIGLLRLQGRDPAASLR